MSKIKILHITPWYPSLNDPIKAIFIQRHIESLAPFTEQHTLHMEWEKQLTANENTDKVTRGNAFTDISNWRWKEWIYYKRLAKKLREMNANEAFTHVNFHIAYPQLVYFNKLKHVLPPKILITEHWSIYHFNFFTTRHPHRLTAMFRHHVPLICVSKALGQSINNFAGQSIAYTVIPNAVDTAIFNFIKKQCGKHFLLAAHWKHPKDAIPVIEACNDLKQKGINIRLRIAGNGPLLEQMKSLVMQYGMQDAITFLGLLNAGQLAAEMNEAAAFIMPSGFETFSVACAEALCCGCPVLADGVGALPELIDNTNGLLRSSNQNWQDVIQQFITSGFDHYLIAQNSQSKYSSEVIGKMYYNFIESI